MRAVMVLGAYGGFGERITRALARSTTLPLITAGRDLAKARELASALGARVTPIAIDARALTAAHLAELRVGVLIDTAGPFQRRDLTLARACIDAGVHGIDLADGADYVTAIASLDAAARERNVLLVSGASTVPALSSAVIDSIGVDLAHIEHIEIGISPGFRGPKGLATIRSILGYVGRPIPAFEAGRATHAIGWSDRVRHRYPAPVGRRDLSRVDVPDLTLLPPRYPALLTLRVRAGLELRAVHRALGLLGRGVRAGLVRDLARHAPQFQALASRLDGLGRDHGAMHVRVEGPDARGARVSRTWTVVAESGSGPDIPATAAVILAKRLMAVPGYAPMQHRGATAAIGVVSLAEFEREWQSLPIRTEIRDVVG